MSKLAILASSDHSALLSGASGLLLFSFIIIIGILAGILAKKIKLPQLTGQIIAGIIIGPSVLNLIGHAEEQALLPITSFAIGLIALTVGSHLNFRRLHNTLGRTLTIAAFEASFAFIAVYACLEYFNPLKFADPSIAMAAHLLFASLACSTSPATILHVIKEKNAKGSLVRTLLVVVALDNIICLIVFEICRAMAKNSMNTELSLLQTALPGLASFVISLVIGLISAKAFIRIMKKIEVKKLEDSHFRHIAHTFEFTLLVLAIMVTHGICDQVTRMTSTLDFPLTPLPIMANLCLGIILANSKYFQERMIEEFELLEQIIFTCFFTLAGMHLNLADISLLTLAAAGAYLVPMALGKVGGATLGAFISKSTKITTRNIGRCLLVQAGMTIALLVVISSDKGLAPIANRVIPVVLIIVVFTELFGTIAVSRALDRAKESGKKRTRLIDFLEEEHIMVGLHADDKWHAIEEMVYFLCKTHGLEIDPKDLSQRVRTREEDFSTACGMGIAVPHAIIPSDLLPENKIYGVFCIANPPIDFDSPDEEDSQIFVLLLTPENKRDYHLEVISTLSRMLIDQEIHAAILKAKSPAAIYEIIHSEEAETFNYFLREDNSNGTPKNA